MEKKFFGKTNDGSDVFVYELTNAKGSVLKVSDLGGIWVGMCVADKNGSMKDVVLGYDCAQDYLDQGCFFGAIVGRSGNRIDKGAFTINGVKYQMAINDNENNLHSGLHYFHTRKWAVRKADDQSITFALLSPDGDQGFPGNFDIQVTYSLADDNTVSIHYEGTSDADTVANMTNHVYFNLGGHESGDILNHEMMLCAKEYTPVIDAQAIPTGEYAPVAGTVMDFTVPKKIGKDIDADFDQLTFTGGYDHNYVLSREAGEMKQMAAAYCEETGIAMEACTDACGVQFYAGNFIETHNGKAGAVYNRRAGFCLESQYYPNSVNQEGFASPILKAGEKYDTTTSYRFYVK